MVSTPPTEFPYTLAYASQMLGESEAYVTQLCDRLGVKTQPDPNTGRPCISMDDVELLRRMIQTEMASRRKAYASYQGQPQGAQSSAGVSQAIPSHQDLAATLQPPSMVFVNTRQPSGEPMMDPAYAALDTMPQQAANTIAPMQTAPGSLQQTALTPSALQAALSAPHHPVKEGDPMATLDDIYPHSAPLPQTEALGAHPDPMLDRTQANLHASIPPAAAPITLPLNAGFPTPQVPSSPDIANTLSSRSATSALVSQALSRGDMSLVVDTITNAKENILHDMSRLLDDKLAGLDELVVELIRSKTENDALKDEIKRLEEGQDVYRAELDKFKPTAFGFFRKLGK